MDTTAVDTTAVDTTAELFNLGWTLHGGATRYSQITMAATGLRRNPNPNPNRTLTLTLTLSLSTLTFRSVHSNVSIWWLRRSVHPKLKSSAVSSSAVVSTAIPSSAAASGPRLATPTDFFRRLSCVNNYVREQCVRDNIVRDNYVREQLCP